MLEISTGTVDDLFVESDDQIHAVFKKLYKSVLGYWGWKLFVFVDFGDICKFGRASLGVLGSFGLTSNCQTQLQNNTQRGNIRKPFWYPKSFKNRSKKGSKIESFFK